MPESDSLGAPSAPATSTPAPVNASPNSAADEELAMRMHALYNRGQVGANWFFWVAALSLVNTALIHLKANIVFVVGLGVTMMSDGVAAHFAEEKPELKTVLTVVAIGFAILVAAVVAAFGYFARNRYNWIFIFGMILYLLDGVLLFLVEDWMCVAFHAYALFSMGGGLMAFRQLDKIENQLRQPAGVKLP